MLYSKDTAVKIRIYKNFTSRPPNSPTTAKHLPWEGPAKATSSADDERQSALREKRIFP